MNAEEAAQVAEFATFTADVVGCPRCNGDHQAVKFDKIKGKHPCSHASVCPSSKKQLLICVCRCLASSPGVDACRAHGRDFFIKNINPAVTRYPDPPMMDQSKEQSPSAGSMEQATVNEN